MLADRFDGRRLNSPNDLVYRSDGTLFFTDPPFGLPGVFGDPDKELPFSGVFSVRDGVVRLVTDELEGPNGLAFSPDERYLYVGNWDPDRKVVMRYELGDDDEVISSSVLFDMTGCRRRGRDRRPQGRRGRQRLRVRTGRDLDRLGRRPPSRDAAPARVAAQPRLGRRRRTDALRHRTDQRLSPPPSASQASDPTNDQGGPRTWPPSCSPA